MSMGGGADKGTTRFKKDQQALARETQGKLFDISDKLVALSDTFFDDYIQPVISQLGDQVDFAIDNFDNLRETALSWAQTREDVFQTQGVEGLNFFMDRMLGRDTSQYFNEQEYAAREGALAVGDIANQEAIAKETMQRQMAARGVNPNSGVAMAGLQGAGINASLAKAQAWTQARRAAETRGDQLASSAGQMGVQMSGLAAPYLGQAGTYTGMGVDTTNAQLQGLSLGWETKTGGLRAAGGILSPIQQQASANTAAAVKSIADQKAQSSAGFGSLLGKVAGVGVGLATGNPLAVTQGLMS